MKLAERSGVRVPAKAVTYTTRAVLPVVSRRLEGSRPVRANGADEVRD